MNRTPIFSVLLGWLILACTSSEERLYPQRENISESVFASGKIKARNQYQAYANATGTIAEIFVDEGDVVDVGTPILSIRNESARLNRESAELNRAHADRKANETKLRDLEISLQFAQSKFENDSLLLERQRRLWNQGVGTALELEQRELAFKNSGTSREGLQLKLIELRRDLAYNERSASKNLAITLSLESDLILKSEVKGRVYGLLKEKGEMVTIQTPLAILGSQEDFVLEMQVDEYDIVKVKRGQRILVSMDSYRGEVFEAAVAKINPLMEESSKSFTVEGIFVSEPPVLYPNLSLEANILIETKENALVIPRSYLLGENTVLTASGDTVSVVTGLKDYRKAEIISGIDENTQLINPIR